MDPTNEQRPGGETEALQMSLAGDVPTLPAAADKTATPRCGVCNHPITAPESVAAGLGRTCRRRLSRLARALLGGGVR